ERQISEQSFHPWKRELGMLEINQAKQLKELQQETANAREGTIIFLSADFADGADVPFFESA
ncbi:MAG: hypothetical protein VYC47_06030, partial [Verrucomicrobiota bacterium]|nr:hypothetical protein [Verrucomicrobiota bacterium]